MRSEAVSVAVIVAVAPIAALAATVAMPFALTVTAAVFEDCKTSPETGARIAVDPSL